jgi:acyl transferase domain-containing protein
VRDGDRVHAVIEASAVNNDGRTMGLTTPNHEAQQAAIEEALARGGIDAGSLTYFEAHGTGTMIGDPIELRALTRVFARHTADTSFCAVGSVKSNLGHLLCAAGIASLAKMTLALAHGEKPPTLHCPAPNPRFDFAASPFYPITALEPWHPRAGARRAGISSFGFGGTNCVMVVCDAATARVPATAPRRRPLPPIVFRRRRHWIEREERPASDREASDPPAPDQAGDGLEAFLVFEERPVS